MARTHVLDPSAIIPALDHPAPANINTVIKAPPPPAGRYNPGDNTCPNCGRPPQCFDAETWAGLSLRPAETGGFDGPWIWFCCYSWCETCSPAHPYDDDDECDECGCPQNCTCDSCSCGEKGTLCDNCRYCEDCCSCVTCYACDEKFSYTCEYCAHCEDCCECHYCSHCDSKISSEDDWCDGCDSCTECCSNSDGDLSYSTHGEDGPGWARRGETVVVRFAQPDHDLWMTVDPVQSMADFYLLSAMDVYPIPDGRDETFAAMMVFIEEARARRDKLVKQVDHVFRTYVDMAVGGELRYHRSMRGSHLSNDRNRAWGQWGSIREQVGPQALLDAAELFRQMQGGSYGGEKWAVVAEVLHSRVTGKLPDWLFVDRVFSIQHNGGSVLDKVSWANFGKLQFSHPQTCVQVGQAHAADRTDYATLAFLAQDDTVGLFRRFWVARNRVLVREGQRPEIIPPLRPPIVLRCHNERVSGSVALNHGESTLMLSTDAARTLWDMQNPSGTVKRVPSHDTHDKYCRYLHPGNERMCRTRSPGNWACTMAAGHEGDHVACNSMTHNLCVWPNDAYAAPKPVMVTISPWVDMEAAAKESCVADCQIGTYGATCSALFGKWYCTRAKGHEGDHIACNTTVHNLQTWTWAKITPEPLPF